MMQFSGKQLKGVPVRTRDGRGLGTLHDLLVDGEVARLAGILVRPSGLLKSLISGDLMISAEKIITCSLEEVMVEDGAVAEFAERREPGIAVGRESDVVMSSEQEI